MTYTDVKSFALTLYADMQERFEGKENQRMARNAVDDETIAELIGKMLRKKTTCHTVIVIDEVDQFSSNERGLTCLVKAILQSSKKATTNCSLVGIANSVDLPFRKKHSAIAMRDCQLLFKPYDFEQLISILETKKCMLYHRLPPRLKSNEKAKKMFHGLIDMKVYEFVAKKVSNLSGDIRVAFDLMKTVLTAYADEIKDACVEEPKIVLDHLLKCYEQKQSSKVGQILASLPRQDIIVLHAAV